MKDRGDTQWWASRLPPRTGPLEPLDGIPLFNQTVGHGAPRQVLRYINFWLGEYRLRESGVPFEIYRAGEQYEAS